MCNLQLWKGTEAWGEVLILFQPGTISSKLEERNKNSFLAWVHLKSHTQPLPVHYTQIVRTCFRSVSGGLLNRSETQQRQWEASGIIWQPKYRESSQLEAAPTIQRLGQLLAKVKVRVSIRETLESAPNSTPPPPLKKKKGHQQRFKPTADSAMLRGLNCK